MSFEQVINFIRAETPNCVRNLSSDKLNKALKIARSNYGKLNIGFYMWLLLSQRYPETGHTQKNPQVNLVKILLGEGEVNFTSFKYLLLQALGFIPDDANDSLSEDILKNVYRYIVGELLSANVIQAHGEELLNQSHKVFKSFLDKLCLFWAESLNSSSEKIGEGELSRIQFKLSSDAMDELYQQLKKVDTTISSNPTAQWPIRAFLLWIEKLKRGDDKKLNLSPNELSKFTEAQWQEFSKALKASSITLLNLNGHGLSKFTELLWKSFGNVLKGSGITSLVLSNNWLSVLTDSQWQAFGHALKGSGITSLDLYGNMLVKLTQSQWQFFGEVLKNNEITSLSLNRNKLFELKWQTLGKALEGSRVIKLSLRGNDLFRLKKSQWQAIGEALKVGGIISLDLSGNRLSFKQWKMLLNVLKTGRKKPLILVGINFNDFTIEQAQILFNKNLAIIKNGIATLTNPESSPLEEERQRLIKSLITELEAQYTNIENLNDLTYLALFNVYYATAFSLAKAVNDTQAALEALESINLSPDIDYPGKEQLSAELIHATLDYALMLDSQKLEAANAMQRAARKLFNQVGQIEEYYSALFNQQVLCSEQVATLLSEVKTMQIKVSACLDSKRNADAKVFAGVPRWDIQSIETHLKQFIIVLDKDKGKENVLQYKELAFFLDELDDLTAVLEAPPKTLYNQLTQFIQTTQGEHLPRRHENRGEPSGSPRLP